MRGGCRRKPQGRWHLGACSLPPAHITLCLCRRKVSLLLPGTPKCCRACAAASTASKGKLPRGLFPSPSLSHLSEQGDSLDLGTYLCKCNVVLRAWFLIAACTPTVAPALLPPSKLEGDRGWGGEESGVGHEDGPRLTRSCRGAAEAALPPPQMQQRNGRSVHGPPRARAYPLFWNTFALGGITPNWLNWEGGYFLLKSEPGNKNATRKTIYLQPCSCQDPARLILAAGSPCLGVSRELWASGSNRLFPFKAGAAAAGGSGEMHLSWVTCPGAQLRSSAEQNRTAPAGAFKSLFISAITC